VSARSAWTGSNRGDPRDPRASTWLGNKARALYHLEHYDEVIDAALTARRLQPHAHGSLLLIASYARLGRNQEAAGLIAEIRALPDSGVKTTRGYLDRYSDPGSRQHMADGLAKGGILDLRHDE
jgi:hypothetical protein